MSGSRNSIDIPVRFRQSLKLAMKLKKEMKVLGRTRYVMVGAKHETDQQAALTLRSRFNHVRMAAHVSNDQSGSVIIKQKYWTLDGSVPLDGSKYLAATSKQIDL